MAPEQSHRGPAGAWSAAIALLSAALACGPSRNPSASIDPEPSPGAGAEPTLLAEAEPTPPALPECLARTPRGGPSLIPDSTQWLVHIAPSVVLGSQAWASLTAGQGMPGELAGLSEDFDQCGLSLRHVEHILVGLDPDGSAGTLVATGPGLGQPQVATCLATTIDTIGAGLEPGAQPRAATLPGDPQVQTIELGDSRVYLFHPDMLVLTSLAQSAELEALSRCAGFPAIDHRLENLVSRTDTSAALWAAGRLPPESATSIESSLGLEAGSVRDVIVSARVDSGLAAQVRLGTRSPSSALAAEAAVGAFLPMMQTLGPPELQPAIQRIELETLGAELMVRASLTDTELRHLGTLF